MKYTVVAMMTISIRTEVEADSPEQAMEIAEDRAPCALIDPERMGDRVDEVWFHSGELDGTPFDLAVPDWCQGGDGG